MLASLPKVLVSLNEHGRALIPCYCDIRWLRENKLENEPMGFWDFMLLKQNGERNCIINEAFIQHLQRVFWDQLLWGVDWQHSTYRPHSHVFVFKHMRKLRCRVVVLSKSQAMGSNACIVKATETWTLQWTGDVTLVWSSGSSLRLNWTHYRIQTRLVIAEVEQGGKDPECLLSENSFWGRTCWDMEVNS